MADEVDSVTIDEDGPLLLIGVNRPDAHNLWDLGVIQAVSRACRRLADTDHLRVGVIFGHGRLFTAGLDLASVAPLVATGDVSAVFPEDGFDPWNFFGEPCPKPIVVAVHGTCNTLGIELALASQAAVAAEGTRFAQLEVARGIFPLGGGTFRLPARLGAAGMRYLLTAERFDADTALRTGLVTEVVPEGRHLERAVDIARLIAANAPLAVQAALASARAAERASRDAAAQVLLDWNQTVVSSRDAAGGRRGFRRAPPTRIRGTLSVTAPVVSATDGLDIAAAVRHHERHQRRKKRDPLPLIGIGEMPYRGSAALTFFFPRRVADHADLRHHLGRGQALGAGAAGPQKSNGD